MRSLRIASLGIAALMLAAQSHAAVITQWNFNDGAGGTATGTTTPSTGAGTAALVGGTTATFATGSAADVPAVAGDNSGWNTSGYPAIGAGNKTAGTQFAVSTAGYQDIVVNFEIRGSNTASRYYRVQYSTDGTTFTDFGTDPIMLTAPDTFFPISADLGAISGVEDNANFAFRIVSEFEPGGSGYVAARTSVATTYTSGGTVRLDLVGVSGSLIPEPAALGLLGLAPLVIARRRSR